MILVCSVLASICLIDFVVSLAWTVMSIIVAVFNPNQAYLAVIIILALNCVAISFGACFISFQHKKTRAGEKCLRFYRCHRLSLAILSLLLGVPLFAVSLWRMTAYWNSLKDKMTGVELLKEPYLGLCFIVGGITLLQGISYCAGHKCFTKALQTEQPSLKAASTLREQTTIDLTPPPTSTRDSHRSRSEI